MRKIFAVLITAIFFATAVPVANAETLESQYLTSSGVWIQPAADNDLPGGNAITVCPDALAWPLDPDWDPVNDPLGDERSPAGCPNPDPIIPHIGSATFFPSGAYGNVQVTPSDDVTGSNAPVSTCLWDPDNSENFCRPNHAFADRTCGSQFVSTEGRFLSSRSTVFVYSFFVTADFGVCAATSGSIVADFF